MSLRYKRNAFYLPKEQNKMHVFQHALFKVIENELIHIQYIMLYDMQFNYIMIKKWVVLY